MKRTIKIVGVNLLILLVLLLIIELCFRFLGYGYGMAPLVNDPDLNHVHPKNFEYTCYVPSGEYGGHTVKYDQYGRRVNEKTSAGTRNKEIWFMGDSFTETTQMSWANSYVGKIERSTNFNAINFGVASYSPIQYYIQLKNELSAKPYKPAMVFIQLYSNDVAYDSSYATTTQFDSLDNPIKCDGGSPELLSNFFRRLYILRVAKRAMLTIQYVSKRELSSSKNSEKRIRDYFEETPTIDHDSRFAKSIRQIHHLLDCYEIKHCFFSIPSKYSCLSGDWKSPTFSSNFIGFMKETNFPYINMDTAFQQSPKPESLFFKKDIHCTVAANKIISQEILKKINQ